MSKIQADEERPDSDPTEELPILLETAVLDPEENGVVLAADEEQTGEHTAQYAALSGAQYAELREEQGANVAALKSDLEQRGAKIAALEQDIARLSARWIDVERHLNAKDTVIGDLSAALANLRKVIDSRKAVERKLTTEIAERNAQIENAAAEVQQLRRDIDVLEREVASREVGRAGAPDEAADGKEPLPSPTPSNEGTDLTALREELATLTSYIANRRAWWDELEARAAAQAARIAELERELAHRTERQQRAESSAEREVARAEALREQLLEQSRRAEGLEAELGDLRAPHSVTTLEAQLAQQRTALADAQAQLTEVGQALAEQRAEQLKRDAEHAAALAAAKHSHAAEIAAANAAAARPSSPPGASIEAIAKLEAEVEQKNADIAAQRTTLAEQSDRLTAAAAELDAALRQLAETHVQLDQAHGGAARIERALIDRDRALEARDERIATLQHELDQKLGALQKLNAMDLSLQGLDSKMSERLRRSDAPADQTNTPALVCLTSDVPRQYAMLKETLTIGRSSSCDVQILTHFVSREHARLTLARGTVMIEDLGSTNGTFVNSVRVDRQELRHGDLVAVGETQFRFLESLAH
jgi:chromosome segregation ATPase